MTETVLVRVRRALSISRTRASPPVARGRFTAACIAGFGAAVALLLWSRSLHPTLLVVTAVAIVAAVSIARPPAGESGTGRMGAWLRLRRSTTAPYHLALGLLVLGLGAGAVTDRRLDRVASDWDALVAARETRLRAELDRRMAATIDRGRRSAVRAAEFAAGPGEPDLFDGLAELRARTGVAALAVFSPQGDLVAWSGDHRGGLPAEVRSGERSIVYAERPLFSYLYFAEPINERGGHAVSAILVEAGLAGEAPDGEALADRFAARTGVRPLFAPMGSDEASWSFVADGDTLVHARFERPSQAEWRARVADQGRRAVSVLAGLALALILVAWLRTRRALEAGESVVPLLGLALALAIAPLGVAIGLHRLFSPALYLLPVLGDVTLGRLLAVTLPLAALAATARAPVLDARRFRIALGIATGVVGLAFAGGLHVLLAGASPPLLEGGPFLWGGLQVACVLVLATLTVIAMPRSGPPDRPRPALVFAGIGLAVALALLALSRWRMPAAFGPWIPMLWAAPFFLAARGLAPFDGRGGKLLRWLVAGFLAATAVIPHLWVVHEDARRQGAERELATLGTRADPYLDYLLRQFANEAIRRSDRGEGGVELLYRSWVGSGLAREGYPARVTLWGANGRSLVELPLGGVSATMSRSTQRPWYLAHAFEQALTTGEPVVESARDLPGVNQILVVPLADGRAISIVVPPRRSLDRASALAPFLGTEPRPEAQLTLIPARSEHPIAPGEIVWHPTDQGWRSEMLVRYPDGEYHAHLDLRLPPAGVRMARAILLLAADLAILALLWILGRTARGDPPAPPDGWAALLRSFRARVTVALFAFFLLPTALFGAVAYRALAGEAARAAQIVADRAVAHAAASFPDPESSLAVLADRIGEDILYYHWGELIGASSPEAFEMGLYGGWMPPSIYRALQSGEEISATEVRYFAADRPTLIAYRRLQAAGALAVPVPMVATDALVRQRELADLILFASVMGALLSLALSVAVGRALARPIGQLRRAAGAVGSGRLGVRLPEDRADEFGELFSSFNRMVRRLRQARTQEQRTARVLAWGEMARQVAHEIKNPLTPIKLSVQHLRRTYADGKQDFGAILNSNVEQILAEIDRLSEIARVFSRYGAPAEAAGPLEAVDVGAVIREALMLYRASDARVQYRDSIAADLPSARGRAGELKEVILNLVENAHAALDGEGRVEVTARAGGSVIEISVSDDGPGIPPEFLPQIFEPHFSTRSSGTGLGLAIVRRLVESWGGSVAAESEPGRGTTVFVRMPVYAEQSEG